MGQRQRGHRVVPHTADVILEAWGADLAACCEEAVAALVGVYADAAGAGEAERRHLRLAPAPPEALLLELLEEAIFTLDTAEGVPVRAEVRPGAGGGLDVVLVLAASDAVTPAGSVPKAVSRSELTVDADDDGFRCRFLVDV